MDPGSRLTNQMDPLRGYIPKSGQYYVYGPNHHEL